MAVGGFGGAGSSRSLRKTMTRGGLRTTATVGKFRDSRRAKPGNIEGATPEDIRRSVITQQCPFCEDMRTFKSLSGHFVRGHGYDLQDIRDYLKVPKGYTFVSEETTQKNRERGKRLYDPEKLRQLGRPRALSAYGIQKQREKLKMAHAAQVVLGTRDIPRICQICGKEYQHINTKTNTCGKVCAGDMKSINFKGRAAPWAHGPRKPPQERECSICGKAFNPRDFGHSSRKTCSDACLHVLQAIIQNQRDLTYLRDAAIRYHAAMPARYCTVAGCNGRHVANGLCGKHYQRLRNQRLHTSP
jgi:hypothetical protein